MARARAYLLSVSLFHLNVVSSFQARSTIFRTGSICGQRRNLALKGVLSTDSGDAGDAPQSVFLPQSALLGSNRPDLLSSDDETLNGQQDRRRWLRNSFMSTGLAASCPLPASASEKSRTEGYEVQKTEAEWQNVLSRQQYFILRQGGTESPYTSVLESEKRPGTFRCAACDTPLFESSQKFTSGTGWPSFAAPVTSATNPSFPNVEMEKVSQVRFQLAGAEVRCQTCGGHLGDVFADGFLFPGTPAAATGKRYCIDGGALVFVPSDQHVIDTEILRGDLPPKKESARVFPG